MVKNAGHAALLACALFCQLFCLAGCASLSGGNSCTGGTGETGETGETGSENTGAVAVSARALIRVYRSCISSQDEPSCLFHPSCSEYTLEAVRLHGLSGILEGLDRVSRCHPLNRRAGSPYLRDDEGYLVDPVVP
jgi:uncharacterized protein